MTRITFIGPFCFFGPDNSIDTIKGGRNGVYLWCVKGYDGIYRVHYIGESFDVAFRLKEHKHAQLRGRYTGFDPDGLRRNIKILMHRAGKGMVPKHVSVDRNEFNRSFLETISIFYADLGSDADKDLRCRYEHSLYLTVEDHGQNILHVGHLKSSTSPPVEILVETPGVTIEALSNTMLHV